MSLAVLVYYFLWHSGVFIKINNITKHFQVIVLSCYYLITPGTLSYWPFSPSPRPKHKSMLKQCVCVSVCAHVTLALVNCTIGPSSDTTWFPTWTKGTLPGDTHNQLSVYTQSHTHIQTNTHTVAMEDWPEGDMYSALGRQITWTGRPHILR